MAKNNIPIQTTTDYSIFKDLVGNRRVNDVRIRKIIASIQAVGYVTNPIIVNEKMEIIDGQGRKAALQTLGMPVDYIIVRGIGINECRSMNIHQTNWTTKDYIYGYAEEGNTSYQYLRILLNKYPKIPIDTVLTSITQNIPVTSQQIQNGEFVCTANDFDHANNTLEYVETFIDTIAGVIGRVSLIYNAIIFAYNNVDFNKNRLQPAFEKYSDRIGNIATMEDALNAVSTVYNYRYLGTKLYLSTDYSRFQDEKNLRKRKKEGRRTRTNI